MIWESSYWKRELFRIAKDLSGRLEQRRWHAASLARVELDVMLGFYMIRKMIEARKISDEIPSRRLHLEAYRPTGRRVTFNNSHKIGDLYDLSSAHRETRTVRFVCNQIVHSFIFVPFLREKLGWDGVIFSSDKEKAKAAYYMSSEDIIALFEEVAFNDPAQTRWWIDQETGEEHMWIGPTMEEWDDA